jgi:glucose/arabinose dehydrogenase
VTLPQGFTRSPVVGGLTNPIDMEFAPDGRLFVAEQRGKVRIVKGGGTLATFLDISAKVDSSDERGLLGLAFDPDFATNHFDYVYYTRKATATTPVHNRVVRVTASGDEAAAGSEKLIYRLNNQNSSFHMGGAIDVASDGKLYVSTGDNQTPERAQSLGNLFGKVLRMNKDGTIPSTNPFYATASGKNRAIWSLGLRNPFKFAVKPGTSTIFINDVGQHRWEEINRGRRAPTTAGPCMRVPSRIPPTWLRSSRTGTMAIVPPPAARSREEPSTARRTSSSQRGTSVTTSSRTIATAG